MVKEETSFVRVFESWYCRAGEVWYFDAEECPKVILDMSRKDMYDVVTGAGWFFKDGPFGMAEPFGPYETKAAAIQDAALLYKGVQERLFLFETI